MKATEILEWICRESINGEFLGMIDVPEHDEGICMQTADWWYDMFGGCPPHPIETGRYLYFYTSQVEDIDGEPDAQIELPTEYGFDYIHLYKMEE